MFKRILKGFQPSVIEIGNPPNVGSSVQAPEYRRPTLAPMPQHTRSNCEFCGKQATCKYKAKFERLKQELTPLEVRCKYYEEWSGYNVK